MPAYPSVINLATLTPSQGFSLTGGEGSYAGFRVATGDVNGDGFADVIATSVSIGVSPTVGTTYVVFGRSGGFGTGFGLGTLNGANGFRLDEVASGDLAAFSGPVGDVNGDGFDDFVVGAPGVDQNGLDVGGAYVVFGRANGFGADFDLATLNGPNGFRITGAAAGGLTGYSVSTAGDINGDGFDDILVSAQMADVDGDATGAAYVVFGKAGGFTASISVGDLNGVNGFRLVGGVEGQRLGFGIASPGDLNGDGVDDLAISAVPGPPPPGELQAPAALYVLYGSRSGFGANVDLSELDGSDGFSIVSFLPDGGLGYSVASAGDVNGDGLDDLIVGAPKGEGAVGLPGASYVVFGRQGGFGPELQLWRLNGTNGFRISGDADGDFAGHSVSSAGDFNGDGFDDLLVGAPRSGGYAGRAYVIFGSARGFDREIDVTTLNGETGLTIEGPFGSVRGLAGYAVTAGDVNGDGLSDLIIAAPGEDRTAPNAGSVYVVYGRLPSTSVDRVGSELAQAIYGGAGDDRLSGLDGADTLTAGGGDDELLGGAGGDRLDGLGGDDLAKGGGGADQIFGGLGEDRLEGGSGDDVLDGGAENDLMIGGSGVDTASYAAAAAAVTVSLGIVGEQQTAGAGVDALQGIEALVGSKFADILNGGVLADKLSGGAGADSLTGGDGADTLIGGAAGDRLAGGLGADRFVFQSVSDSQGSARAADKIVDLAVGDLIDLSAIDADVGTGGNQAFVLQSAFTGIARQLVRTYEAGENRTLVQGDTDGDGDADFILVLQGGDFSTFTGFVL